MNRIFILCLLLLLSSCGLKVGNIDVGKIYETATEVNTATKEFSKEEELELGKSIAAQLLGASKYYEDESVQNYVSKVGQWLAMQLPKQEYDWHFVVLEDDIFNAYTTPGGMVFINTGLLEKINTEAQLAAILSHEIIHSYRSHFVSTIQKTAGSKAMLNALSLAADQSSNKKVKQGQELWETTGDQITNMYFRGFDREYELESDIQGTYLLAKAGYDPYSMIEVLQIIEGIDSNNIWFKQFYDTHPLPEERLATVFKLVDTNLAYLSPVSILEGRYKKATINVK